MKFETLKSSFLSRGAQTYLGGVCGIILILVAITALAYRNVQEVKSLSEKRTKKRQIILETEKLAILMLQANMSFRDSFNRDGQKNRFDESEINKEIRNHVDNLLLISKGTASEQDCARLAVLISDREAALMQIQNKHSRSPKIAQIAKDLIEREKDHFQKIHGLAKQIEETQKDKINQIDRDVLRIARTNSIFIVVGAIFCIGLLLATSFSLQSYLTQKNLAEAKWREAHELAISASQSKSDFIANISHEIRTPINGIIGMTTLLDLNSPRADQRDSIATIRNSSQVLLTLINDLLDFSKAEAGRIELEILPFDIRRIVEETVDLFSESANRKGVLLSCYISSEVPKSLSTDPTRYRQILSNLISNALKFTNKGEVSVSVSALSPLNGGVTLVTSVRDTGMGIQEKFLPKLFQPFYQADPSTTRKFGGTGLGLSICKRLSELLGGDIEVTSHLGEGSLFTFRIQAQVVEALRKDREALEQFQAKIVTQDELFSARLRKILSSRGIAICETDLVGPKVVVITDGTKGDTDFWKAELSLYAGVVFYTSQLTPSPSENQSSLWLLAKPLKPRVLFETLARICFPSGSKSDLVQFSSAETNRFNWKKKVSVLVAEDNPINQKVAVRLLQAIGIQADVACDGQEAVTRVLQGSYDLVLMDCQMPEKDGFEAARELRRALKDKTLPIVALTASVSESAQQKCREAGMDDFIAKPIDFSKLCEVVGKHLASLYTSSLDTSQLAALSALDRPGEKTLFHELYELFQKDLPQLLSQLESAFLREDGEQVSRIAHRLKGSSYQLGAIWLSEICHELESRSRSNESLASLRPLHEKLQIESRNVLEEGKRLLRAA